MDQLEELHSKLQSIVSKLIKTADNRAQLEQLKQQMETDWAEYQRLAMEIHPTLTSDEDIKELNEEITKAVRTANEQGIKAKLEKLIELVAQSAALEKKGEKFELQSGRRCSIAIKTSSERCCTSESAIN